MPETMCRKKAPFWGRVPEHPVGAQLWAALAARGDTVSDLARRMGVHVSVAARWFRGVRPRRETAERIAARYKQQGITLELLGYS